MAVAASRGTGTINHSSANQSLGDSNQPPPAISTAGVVLLIIFSILGVWFLGLRLQRKEKLNRMCVMLQHVAQLERQLMSTPHSERYPNQ